MADASIARLMADLKLEAELYYLCDHLPDGPGFCIVCHRHTAWRIAPLCVRCAQVFGRPRAWPDWLKFLELERHMERNTESGHAKTPDLLDDLAQAA